MQKIDHIAQLKSSIILLELKQAEDAELLKEQFKISYESLKPINLAKKFMKDLVENPEIKKGILDTSISLGAGYLTKKVAVGSSHNPIKQILGTLLQMGVTSLVSNNTDGIKSTVAAILKKLFTKNRSIN